MVGMQLISETGLRESLFRAAIVVMAVWSVYCLLDLLYVVLGYFALAPGLPLLTIFSEPQVAPGFWGDYLKRLSASWGSVVTGLGVVALLLRSPVQVVEGEERGPVATYPIIPEEERTEPRLLYVEESGADLPEPAATRREAARRAEPQAPTGRRDAEAWREGEGWPIRLEPEAPRVGRRAEAEPRPAWRDPELRKEAEEHPIREGETRRRIDEAARREPHSLRNEPRPEFGDRGEQEGQPRPHPMRSAPFLRALRGRAGAAPQPEPVEQQPEPQERDPRPARAAPPPRRSDAPRLFAGAAAEEFSFFEVRYDDGTATVERVRRAEFSGDEAVAISLVRRRIAEETAAGRRPAKSIAAVTPISYFGFPNRSG